MVVKSQVPVDVLSTLDRTYGLIDGSTRWSDYLESLINLVDIQSCSLYLYDCARSQSRLIEAKGDGRRDTGAPNKVTLDDFLWRSQPGTVWLPFAHLRSESAAMVNGAPSRGGHLRGEGYAVIDRDQTHILYLAFSGRELARNSSPLLEKVLPHVHRACRLQRSMRGMRLLQLVDPDRSKGMDTTNMPVELRLRRRFKLSKAEARVAKLLAEGLAPRMIADRLHVSIHTVRSQLQSIFQKTDTCRQAELTSLLLRETEIPTAICQTGPVSIESQEQPPCL